MNIEPVYSSVGNIFRDRPMFFIPKYQRAYAWETESVEDFIKDLKSCFARRKSNSPVIHFFGGILGVRHQVTGAVNQFKYEIIDGQQRIATFTILVSCLIKIYNGLVSETKEASDKANELILEKRIQKLSERFIKFDQEVQRKITYVEVLELSTVDRDFYTKLIQDQEPSPTRDSHNKILNAYKKLLHALRQLVVLDGSSSLENKMDDLEIIQNIIDNDFTILYLVTDKKDDAFRLFQVINDRGTSLTEGDLLRAKTLELLEGFHNQQNEVEKYWDDILSDPPSQTKDYLNWIYESYQGDRAKQSDFFDLFIDAFFPQNKELKTIKSILTTNDADQIYQKMTSIYEDIIKCRKIMDGQWLYPDKQPIMYWDRVRLTLLVKELDHTLSIPLLLAASHLDHKVFSEIVQLLEKSFFRYKTICNQHATPLKKIYCDESLAIRQSLHSYDVCSLKKKLQNLIKTKAPDHTFKNLLATLEYKESGSGSNKVLKYFLMTIEYYYQWYQSGAVGNPGCFDKSRVYDFAGTSIEHIYPQRVQESSKILKLEPLKNTLGNLTILDPKQNTIGGNDDFNSKQNIYLSSSVLMTREIAKNANWTEIELKAHNDLLINIALKIFYPF